MSEPLVDLIIEEPAWQEALPELQEVADLAAKLALDAADLDPDRFTISLLACNDDRMSALNKAFRGKAVATNVLSWPAFDLSPARAGESPGKPPEAAGSARTLLGDVSIGLPTCRREAQIAAIPLKNHVTDPILHGCLHLLGFDHETDTDADIMEGIERSALLACGIQDPYGQQEVRDRRTLTVREDGPRS